jgi:hypothetical protein
VTAQNDPPVAEADNYDGGDIGAGFVVGNLFDNDTDTDFELLVDGDGDGVLDESDGDVPNKSRWTAVIVDADGNEVALPPGLSLDPDVSGAFTYDPSQGSVEFYYKIDTGMWSDTVNEVPMSADSNIAMVTITLGYEVTIEPLKSRARLGSDVNVTFQIRSGGNIISDLGVVKLIQTVNLASGKTTTLYSNPPASGDKGKSSLRFLTQSESFRLNWDTTEGTQGEGRYTVLITLDDDPSFNPRTTPNAVELR